MTGKWRAAFAVAICAIAFPGVALAAVSKPRSGHWRLGSGGFEVGPNQRSITRFNLKDTNCDLGRVTVTTPLALRLITEGGVSDWVVGYADPRRTSRYDEHGVIGQRVVVRAGHKTMRGRLEIIFASGATPSNRVGDGDLVIAGCDAPFSARR